MGMYDSVRLNFENGSGKKLSSPIFGSSKQQVNSIDVAPGLEEIIVHADENLQTIDFLSRTMFDE